LNLKTKAPPATLAGLLMLRTIKTKRMQFFITAFLVVLSYVSVYSIFIKYYKDSEGYKNCNKCNKKYF